jgi:hypothetical protein
MIPKYMIQTKERNQEGKLVFKTLWKSEVNPVQGVSTEEIKRGIKQKWGKGWYQFYKSGSKNFSRVNIFVGDIE